LLGFYVASVILVSNPLQLESQVSLPWGHFERWRHEQDETWFEVRFRASEGQTEKIVERSGHVPGVTSRIQAFGIFKDSADFVWIGRRVGALAEVLGSRLLRYDWANYQPPCSALALLNLPTPLDKTNLFWFSNLNCASYWRTETLGLVVKGKEQENYLDCHPLEPCLWQPQGSAGLRQQTAFGAAWRAEQELLVHSIKTPLPQLNVRSWAFEANRSFYDVERKTIFFGSGEYPDALDGFVVAHEWAHFLIDHINPGLIGQDAHILHEAIADFYAAAIWNDSCFAPYDAQELDQRDCVRQLANQHRYPEDFSPSNRHYSSQIVSGALWALRQDERVAPYFLARIVETLIRLPKNPSLTEFWQTFLSVTEDSVNRDLLDSSAQQIIREEGIRRGLLAQAPQEP
jgi:hypothetical protein